MSVRTPLVLLEEPFATLSRGAPFFQHEVLSILDITIEEFATIRFEGYLKPNTAPCSTPLYNRKEVVAFLWSLHACPRHADTIGLVIGRRGVNWSTSEDAAAVNPCGPYDYHRDDFYID